MSRAPCTTGNVARPSHVPAYAQAAGQDSLPRALDVLNLQKIRCLSVPAGQQERPTRPLLPRHPRTHPRQPSPDASATRSAGAPAMAKAIAIADSSPSRSSGRSTAGRVGSFRGFGWAAGRGVVAGAAAAVSCLDIGVRPPLSEMVATAGALSVSADSDGSSLDGLGGLRQRTRHPARSLRPRDELGCARSTHPVPAVPPVQTRSPARRQVCRAPGAG